MIPTHAPSPFFRLAFAGYIYYVLLPLHAHPHPALKAAAPWILHIFFMNILMLVLPGLWSGRVSVPQCLGHVEGIILYFWIISVMKFCFWGDADLIFDTYAILYQGWHLWQNLACHCGAHWIQSPGMMHATLLLYLLVLIPLAWMQQAARISVGLCQMMASTLICDASFVILNQAILLYKVVFEL